MEHSIRAHVRILLGVAALGLPISGLAAGFAITEQNATGLGDAYAGATTGNGHASGQYFNPATMANLSGTQLSAGLIDIAPNIQFSNGQSSVAGIGNITNGNNGGNAGEQAWVPNLFLSHALDARTRVGFGLSVPYGLATQYQDGWVGRYHALTSQVQVINLSPSLSYRLSPTLSIGAGLDAQYAKANLSSAIDSGSLCYGAAAHGQVPGGLATCNAYGLTPGNSQVDGLARVKGHDWAFGWNIGLIYNITPDTRLGLAYRAAVDHKLKGQVTYSHIPALLASNPQLADTGASAALDLPAMASLGVSQRLDRHWTMSGDLTWTQWSRFSSLRVVKDNGQPDLVTTENWRDTMRYAVGLTFRQNERLTWRGGLALDQTPVPDARHRTARLPGSDRTWLSLGMGYRVSPQLSWDLGYTYILFRNVSINNTTEGSYQNTLTGQYRGHVNMFGAQANYRF
ncbi:OmpP1/FadL family transporter [Acidihalobacter yilgarnensis]|uniref:OmpP1/FadL family transporter n=1 Tax=Acidihalobacter yilgarnensis TaxID=2819280 RepID=UPI0009F5FB82|nr:outer membrane protein transport protein [Acidihalobacter yilgarnensis]